MLEKKELYKKENHEIELLRFAFCLLVVLGHFHWTFSSLEHFENGWIGVDFFFLLSGLLMARSVSGRMDSESVDSQQLVSDTKNFVLRKIGGFYKYFLAAIILNYILGLTVYQWTAKALLTELVWDIPKLLLVNMFGMYPNATDPTWYLSAMTISICLLYPILRRRYKIASNLIFPSFGFILMGIQFVKSRNVSQITDWYGIAYGGLIRGISLIALGVWCFEISKSLSSICVTKLAKVVLTLLKCLCYLSVFAYALMKNAWGDCYIAAILLCMIAITLSWTTLTYTIKPNAICKLLGKVSLPIYLYHSPIKDAITHEIGTGKSAGIVFLVLLLTLILCALMMFIVDIFCAMIKKYKHIFIQETA